MVGRVLGTGLLLTTLALACSGSSNSDGQVGGSKKGESCAKSPDCNTGLKCIEQQCVPDLQPGFCETYASSCGEDPADCNADCFDTVAASSDDCWFKACGAIVGKCDGDEPDDVSITNCANERGWR